MLPSTNRKIRLPPAPDLSVELGLPAAMSVELKAQERSWCDSKKAPVDAENPHGRILRQSGGSEVHRGLDAVNTPVGQPEADRHRPGAFVVRDVRRHGAVEALV